MLIRTFIVLAVAASVAACATRSAPRTPAAPAEPAGPAAVKPTDPLGRLLPRPSQVTLQDGTFAITPATVIYAESERFAFSARFLAEHIGLAVGPAPLKVEVKPGNFPDGSIVIRANNGTVTFGPEHYLLSVSPRSAVIHAESPAAAFYAVQTLRQLLPAEWEYEGLRPPRRNAPPVTIPALTMVDGPRFSWRGAMLDVARHFLQVHEVKRFIDLMALHKLNRLHLHLADDQGWRIDIRSWPNLATHGGSTEVGGGTGGFYGQDQYADIVRYAADRFIMVIPEIDMPGHTNAALASYAELNCDNIARPLYTGTEVGFSALCVDKDITYKFIDDVVREIAALTPGPYFHIGGDEVKTLTPVQYGGFIERVQGIVRSHGKQMIGWDEIAPTKLDATSIVQHWRPKTSIAEVEAKGAKVIMSIADRMYLDMKYDTDTPIGLTWAGIVSVKHSYDWDPATAAPGISQRSMLGVEAPLWAETITNIRDYEFLAFPRLAAIAEIGWSPQELRKWDEFRDRLAAQGPRWTALGLNFYRSPEVPWR
ncbi:MAG TPA: beta-N-acetylhexosaminidase [Vicinamibacterales bacterium]|nr:beta-N-acetylhexosaminidase [Vicinamibacterales bacterium]